MADLEVSMKPKPCQILIAILLLQLGPAAIHSRAQQAAAAQQTAAAPAAIKVVQLTGLAGVKSHTKGTVQVENGSLQFVYAKSKTELPVASIEDVVTGNDSQRALHGTFGNLTMLAPYGAGRFLGLFRNKLDTLTLQYRDADGALHGTIFTMNVGQADPLKKLLVAQGAHTSLPTPEGSASADAKPDATKEHQP
jgi:hypothetical protein